jgi:hypothetical protein
MIYLVFLLFANVETFNVGVEPKKGDVLRCDPQTLHTHSRRNNSCGITGHGGSCVSSETPTWKYGTGGEMEEKVVKNGGEAHGGIVVGVTV